MVEDEQEQSNNEEEESYSSMSLNSTFKIIYDFFLIPFIVSLIVTVLLYLVFTRYTNYDIWVIIILLVVAFILILYIVSYIIYMPKPRIHYMMSIVTGDVKSLDELPFTHMENKENEFMAIGSTPIVIDGKTHIFLGGSKEQDDSLLIWNDTEGKYEDIIDKTNLSDKSRQTMSAVSFDFDGDGKTDLIIGRVGEVVIYKQLSGYQFKKIVIALPKDKVPTALSISDFNKDSKPDIYISYFIPQNKFRGAIFNDPKHNRDNQLLMGLGNMKFRDVTVRTKSAGKSNTFTSAWIDIDNDSYPDLVLAHDSHEVEILRNKQGKGGREFESTTPFDGKGNWMGIGAGDLDKDGDTDLFLTNIGADFSKSEASQGDIRKDQKQIFKHILLRNDGQFKFTEISDELDMSGDGFGWGAIIEDLNHDGKMDILFGENFAMNILTKIFPGVGYYYKNITREKNTKYPKMTMKREFTYRNPGMAQTPMLADTKGDGIKDVIWVNMTGNSYIQQRKPDDPELVNNNYINVKLPDAAEFVNAKVIVTLEGGKELMQEVIQGGTGFGGKNNEFLTFGLGKATKIKEVRVHTIHDSTFSIQSPQLNSTIMLKMMKEG
jgi:hypothetical protein